MIVPVFCPDGKLEEWAMVELQGRFESTSESEVSEIGMLQISPTDKDIVQLIIGYHQLEGKKVPLKKPFAILEKVEVLETQTQEEDPGAQYQVVGVVRNKVLFKNRPTALISKPRR